MGWSDKWEIEIIPAPKPTFSQQLREQNAKVDKWIKEICKAYPFQLEDTKWDGQANGKNQ